MSLSLENGISFEERVVREIVLPRCYAPLRSRLDGHLDNAPTHISSAQKFRIVRIMTRRALDPKMVCDKEKEIFSLGDNSHGSSREMKQFSP